MLEMLELYRPDGAETLTDIMAALQDAAIAHSLDLNIGHDRMRSDFGVLWMMVRCTVTLRRRPFGAMRIRTFLRKPTALASVRDFTLLDEKGECGTAMQYWVLVDAKLRKLVPLKTVPALQSVPTPPNERTDLLRRLPLPEHLADTVSWTVSSDEIDSNGHLNHIAYVRHAEALQKTPCLGLEIMFNRECFAGETLLLQTCGGYVRGLKSDGEESFRCYFKKENDR